MSCGRPVKRRYLDTQSPPTKLRGMLSSLPGNERYVRPVPGFFAAIFSVVTQFDVCPVGWYNRAMELFRRQGNRPQSSRSLPSSHSCGSNWSPGMGRGLNGYETPIMGAVMNPRMRVAFPMKWRPGSGLLASLILVVPC